MKKFIASVLALAMCLMAAVPAYAATINQDTPDPKTSEADITTSIAPTYTVSIPEDVDVEFNATETQFGTIEIIQAQIDPDKQIEVSITSGEALINQTDNTKTLPYTIEDGSGEFTFAAYLAEGDKTDLTINITEDDWNAAYAGDYSDTVTFTVSYADKA